jgi:quercetin dioxygenase-like cupin family protein
MPEKKKMSVLKWSEVPVENLGSGFTRQVILGEKMMLCRNEIKAGSRFDPHRHEELMQYVLKGRLKFTSGKDVKVVGAGEVIVIPEGVEHGIEVLEDSLVIDVFSPPKSDYLEKKEGYLKK